MQNALAVYTERRALKGRELTDIAFEVGISIRFLAIGGYIPSRPDDIQNRALTTINGGALLVVGGFMKDASLVNEFDMLIDKCDQQAIAVMLNEGQLPWCELYAGPFNYEESIKAKPKDRPKIDRSVGKPQLARLKSAKVRYIIYNPSRRKNCGELMERIAEAIASATVGIVANYQRPSR